MKFPEHARPVEREPETDEEIVRRMPVRGMVRRMMANSDIRLVDAEPAKTPHETIMEWAAGLTGKPSHADLDDLAVRLRDALAFEEDGALAGGRIVDALTVQAVLIRAWPLRARLNTLAGQLEWLLRELGML